MRSSSNAPSVETPFDNRSQASSDRQSDTSYRRAAALRPRETHVLQTNPFALLSYQDAMDDAALVHESMGLPHEDLDTLQKGAALAKAQEDDLRFESIPELQDALAEHERAALKLEREHPWKSLPLATYFLASICAGCAVVQGADQTIVNGAMHFYFQYFSIGEDQPELRGFINGAPYISAALVGCWISAPLNKRFGRRVVLFLCCLVAVITAFTQAVSPNWQSFVASRFILGLAVGPKSATTPVFAAEAAPKRIRGALVMQWQMFTAFGIMLGYIIAIACQGANSLGENTQWRWMLGATSIPPLIILPCLPFLAESPRWYIEKGRLADSFKSFSRLRSHKILAARDFYSAYKHNEAATRLSDKGWNEMFKEFMKPRNLRAAQNAFFVMIMQQFCGVNVLAYYSTQIFTNAGFSREKALLYSFGCGAVNFGGALPAFFTIDRFGRRKLLLITLPILGALLWVTSGCFNIKNPDAKTGGLITSLYLFMFAYSPGMGPVPFTYSAEVFSLSARPLGMSSATSITWMFNFVISFTFPKMQKTMGSSGAFIFFGACNIIGTIYVFFFLPETKELSLEAMDELFSTRNRYHAAQKVNDLKRGVKKNILRQDLPPVESLVAQEHSKREVVPDEEKADEPTGRPSLVRNRETGQTDGQHESVPM